MSAPLIVTSELAVEPECFEQAEKAWIQFEHATATGRRSTLYRSLDGTSLLEFTPLSEAAEIEALRGEWIRQFKHLAQYAAGDFSRELLHYVEAPKDIEEDLPRTRYVQMRHVEVKPEQYRAYRAWREETIFDVVRGHEAVKVFLAYHSVFSSAPGVMFIAGFDCDVEQYNTAFTSPRYQEIVKQAGDQYITGGERGLYTKFYERVDGR